VKPGQAPGSRDAASVHGADVSSIRADISCGGGASLGGAAKKLRNNFGHHPPYDKLPEALGFAEHAHYQLSTDEDNLQSTIRVC
jgi:hypothetical protein